MIRVMEMRERSSITKSYGKIRGVAITFTTEDSSIISAAASEVVSTLISDILEMIYAENEPFLTVREVIRALGLYMDVKDYLLWNNYVWCDYSNDFQFAYHVNGSCITVVLYGCVALFEEGEE